MDFWRDRPGGELPLEMRHARRIRRSVHRYPAAGRLRDMDRSWPLVTLVLHLLKNILLFSLVGFKRNSSLVEISCFFLGPEPKGSCEIGIVGFHFLLKWALLESGNGNQLVDSVPGPMEHPYSSREP